MKGKKFRRSAWIGLTIALVLSGAAEAQTNASDHQAVLDSPQQAPQNRIETLPDSPGAIRPQPQAQPAQNPEDRINGSTVLITQATEPQQSTSSTSAQKPVGTAAAEAPNAAGVAASEPAGIAIAPAKQHRVRTIVLKTGAIIAAGVAVGAVVALTAATPSRPPGAH